MIDIGVLQGRIAIDGVDSAIQGIAGLSGGFSAAIGVVSKFAGALAIGAAIKKCVDSANELKQSINLLAMQTGATSEEMDGLEQSIKNIYAQNYGESFEDIASAMATVKQQTGLTGQELEDATRNAMALSDVFGFEVNESIRSVEMMTKQFGISSDEAFNLIVQGAQNGLDKNGDLLDSINEYSVHFSQLGIDAEGMFNMLANGADSGTFSVDKLGDAVKEFGIRAKVLDDSGEAFATLGFNAEEMVDKFNQGGEVASEAFRQVNEALFACSDATLQNTLGVELYGTMWEDLGVEGVKALTNINGEFDGTLDSMNKINEIKYDDFASALEGIGRQIEVGLIVPVGEMLLPYLEKFSKFINDNMPAIQKVFEVTLGAVGVVIDACGKVIEVLIGWIQKAIDIVVEFAKNTETSGSSIAEIWESIKECIDTAIEFIRVLIESFIDICTEAWNEWGGTITSITETAWNLFKTTIDSAIKFVTNVLNVFTALLRGDFSGAWESFKQLISDVWDGIWEYIDTTIDGIINLFRNLLPTLFGCGEDMFSSLFDGMQRVWDNISNWVGEKMNWLKDKLSFWDNSTSRMNISGSHRIGLDYVPVDGYVAELHKGEMILTQSEANRYRARQLQSQQPNVVVNTDNSKLEYLLSQLNTKLDRLPKNLVGEARLGYL